MSQRVVLEFPDPEEAWVSAEDFAEAVRGGRVLVEVRGSYGDATESVYGVEVVSVG